MAVTIKDVAALAGVSVSTVSRVCSGNAATTRQTRERVLKAIAELGYEYGAPPENSMPKPGITIAVVLPPSGREAYENSVYLKMIRGIGFVCNQHQAASITVTGSDQQELLDAVKNLHQSKRADGFILLYSRKEDAVAEYLRSQKALYVVVGKVQGTQEGTISIDNDNLMAGKEATEYLIRLGHRRIGCLGRQQDYAYAADRKSGYQLALLQNGLPLQQEYCVEIETLSADSLSDLQMLLLRENRPTGFVVFDDLLALALERICVQMGMSIPGDMSVIAFNDSLYAQLVSPQLTAVDVNSYQLGYEAALQVLKHAENPDHAASKTVVPHRILERGSCQRNIGE